MLKKDKFPFLGNWILYLLDVTLPKKLITTYNKEIEFKQEMQGSAEIITEDLHLIERLFYQFKDILRR